MMWGANTEAQDSKFLAFYSNQFLGGIMGGRQRTSLFLDTEKKVVEQSKESGKGKKKKVKKK